MFEIGRFLEALRLTTPRTGRMISEDGGYINEAEILKGTFTDAKLYSSGLQSLFNRIRVVQSRKLFDNQLQYDKQPLYWDEKLTGTGATLFKRYSSALDLIVNADGDTVERQLKEYLQYQSGNAQVLKMTYTPDANSTDISLFLRTTSGAYAGSTEGVPYDLVIPRSSWNYDKLDGTGPSGVTLDLTASQILVVDLEWLSIGTVRYGLEINGSLKLVHTLDNANMVKTAYMTTANLPARYEIKSNSGTVNQKIGYFDKNNGVGVTYSLVGTAGTLKQICTAIESEGGEAIQKGVIFNPNTGESRISLSGNSRTVIAVRHLLAYQGKENTSAPIPNHVKFLPSEYHIGTKNEDVYYRLVYNPTVTGGSWSQFVEDGIYSAMETNTTGTITGGLTIDSNVSYASTQGNNVTSSGSKQGIASKLPFGIGIDEDTPIALALEIVNLSSSNTIVDYGIKWTE